MDYEEDFADDEGAPIIEGNDEDNRDVEEKIKREMLTANAIGDADEEPEEEDEEPKVNKEGKRLQRYLKNLEKNMVYESDDEDANPYASDDDESSSDSTPEEKKRLPKQTAVAGGLIGTALGGSRTITPSTGTSTPRIRRKLVKLNVPRSFLAQLKPNPNAPKLPPSLMPTNKRRRTGSELESAAEASDASRTKKQRTRISTNNTNAVPSPVATPKGVGSPGGSPGSQTPPRAVSPSDDLLTEAEVAAVISSRPMTTKEFANLMKPRLRLDPRNKELLTTFVKRVAKLQGNVLVAK